MQKAVEEALAKLEIVSPYGKTNEKEDFAETFVAFVGAPEKLTPTATYRMKRTLSVSGLYGKPVMQLAKRVAERFTANVVPFKPKKPSGPTLLISGRKYVLSDYFPMLSGLAEEQTAPGGARLITTGPPRFSYLWAYDTDKKFVAMWRVSDGDEKAGGSASHYTSDVVTLERKGQLNRVTHEEFRAIERYMSEQYHDTMAALKKYIAENANEWDKEAKEIAKELFEEKFLPRILAKFHEVEQGVTPLGFKVNEHMLSHRIARGSGQDVRFTANPQGLHAPSRGRVRQEEGHRPRQPSGGHSSPRLGPPRSPRRILREVLQVGDVLVAHGVSVSAMGTPNEEEEAAEKSERALQEEPPVAENKPAEKKTRRAAADHPWRKKTRVYMGGGWF